ncbi:MAG: S-layer family protein [Cyanobacteria bacterium J06592_8]
MYTHPTRLSCTGFWVASVSSLLLATTPTAAQIVPDNTLGNESSVVVPNQNIRNIESDRIDGGAVRRSNLFHSFQEFNIDAGRGAYFSNPDGIANILTRVTGENVSNILGRLGVLGNANLFLINPNGIIFGENASLDIGGSFFATSADRVVFGNGSEFSATNPNTPPLLVINIPIGLGFRDNPGSIVHRSFASVVEVDEETGEEFETFIGLQVPSGQMLALLGGEVSLDGGILTTEGGRVELGSVAGNSFVSLIPQNQGFALSYAGVSNFQDVGLSNLALIETTGERGGEIQIQGRQVSITGDSLILSFTLGSEAGGDITVTASESVDMSGDATQLGTNTSGTGTAGNLTIDTQRLVVRDGAFISTPTLGAGNAGNLTIRTSETVELVGTTSDDQFPSGLFAEVGSGASTPEQNQNTSGQGGTITIETGQLLIQDGAQVSVATFGTGQAGNIMIRASDSLELIGGSQNFPSALSADVEEAAMGNGGIISIETQRLRVRDGAIISTATSGSGQAGDLFITASDSVELSGTTAEENFPSGLFSQVGPTATGNGGNLTVITPRLVVENGAQIATTSRNEGNGGDINLNVSDSIVLSGTASVSEPDNNQRSGIFASADDPIKDADGNFLFVDEFGNPLITRGNGGQLNLNTNELIVEEGARISADNFGTGLGGNANINVSRLTIRNGGQIGAGSLVEEGAVNNQRGPGGILTVNASDRVEVTGTATIGSTVENSRLFTLAEGTGNAGNLTIFTPNLTVTNQGEINVSATGTGEAGSLIIESNRVRLNQGSLRAETQIGEQGNITLNANDIQLRGESEISTNSLNTGTGGNIEINTDLLVAVQNSDITANAQAGPGGRVTINANAIFGTQFRPQQSGASDITATSELGPEFSGTVDLNSEIDTSQGLVELSRDIVDPAALIAQTPCQEGDESEFTITGRGGLPNNPTQGTRQRGVSLSLTEPVERQQTQQRSQNPSQPRSERKNQPVSSLDIVPARGWIRNSEGEIILVGYDPTKTGVQRQPHQPIQCQSHSVESGENSSNK